MDHEILNRRSLSFSRMVVWHIDHDPDKKGLLAAKNNVAHMKNTWGDSADVRGWEKILSLPWQTIRRKLREKSDEMQFLRQSTPFLGRDCLPQELRNRIVAKYQERYAKSCRYPESGTATKHCGQKYPNSADGGSMEKSSLS